MQDQFGNYVVQCLLSVGQAAHFVLVAFHRHVLAVATSRFGARALKNALMGTQIHPRSKRLLFLEVCALPVAWPLLHDPHGIVLVHWLLDAHGADLTATLCSQLKGKFASLVTAKPTASVVCRLLETTSIARPVILAELFRSVPVDTVWNSPVAAAVLAKALQLAHNANNAGTKNGGEDATKGAYKLCQTILGKADASSGPDGLRLHQDALVRQAKQVLPPSLP